MEHRVFPDQPDAVNKYGEMLFMNYGMEFKSEQLSKGMANVTRPIVGWSVTVSSWRHINIAWKRKLCKGMRKVVEQTVRSTIHALQSGHSVASENRLCGLSPDALLGASEDVLQLFLDASTEWQVVNKVVPGGHVLPYHECTMDHFDHLCNEGIIKDKSQGISSKGVDDLFVAMTHVQETVLKAVKDLSVKVQQLQDELKGIQTKKDLQSGASDVFIPSGFPSSSGSVSDAFMAPVLSSPLRDIASPRLATPPRVSLLVQLKRLYGAQAKWTGKEQREAVKALLALEKDVIVALRTGGGKTAIAILPSMVENGYTVIVVPLVSLMDDWRRRLDEFGLPYEHFQGQGSPELKGHANIILVSSDVAKYDHWKKCITRLNTQRPVLRMVVDEAHYYFTDVQFRTHAMANSFTLRHMPMQVVLLSGTIPPNAEAYLNGQFVLKEPIKIRSLSARLEIEYIRAKPRNDVRSMVAHFSTVPTQLQGDRGWSSETVHWFVSFMEDGKKVAETTWFWIFTMPTQEASIRMEEREGSTVNGSKGNRKGWWQPQH
ncbi:hypothetical protein APHAL10511_004975 [Amanita phalloides]|nr:hypothetical protein APHAL10511_004975 [Amanita phalloides]